MKKYVLSLAVIDISSHFMKYKIIFFSYNLRCNKRHIFILIFYNTAKNLIFFSYRIIRHKYQNMFFYIFIITYYFSKFCLTFNAYFFSKGTLSYINTAPIIFFVGIDKVSVFCIIKYLKLQNIIRINTFVFIAVRWYIKSSCSGNFILFTVFIGNLHWF